MNRQEALELLHWPESDLPELLQRAWEIRHRHFGRTVKLNFLVNLRSGVCAEDCHYCSQSKLSRAEIPVYPMLPPETAWAAAERGLACGARRICLVASGRGPTDEDLEQVCAIVSGLLRRRPDLEICACLGLLSPGQAARLKEAGVFAYNHNLNTSERHYPNICSTHTYRDRWETVERVKAGGLSVCSGVLFGMGETDEDIVDSAFSLRELRPDSIPINFLMAIPRTPLEGKRELTPARCLKILCLFRLLHPSVEIRIAGGREIHLGSLQPLGLLVANSIFLGDYLTTRGQPASLDLRMMRELGLRPAGEPGEDFGPEDIRPLARRLLARPAEPVSLELKSKTARG